MKIAITGATGFIGSYLIEGLKGKYELVGITRDASKCISKSEVNYKLSDYSKESLMDALLGCEAVVHLAAIRPLKGQESDYLIYNKNVELTSNIFESCRNVGISNIVFASSRSVYNPRCNNIPFKTSDKIEYTLNLYGLSKYFCEKLALYYNHYYGMDIKSLRLAQVLGVGEKEGVMVTEFIKRAMSKEPLIVYGEGKGKRHYVYVKDIVSAVEKALLNQSEEKIFNIAMENNISHRAFAELVNLVFDNINNIVFAKELKEDTDEYLMDITHTKKYLNWFPSYDMYHALLDMRKILENEMGYDL
ncbi:NAD dependent epimerase [Defluviitoga tunisiensis]|uniref:NAD dependent epimerase n=1 Tax=Defluviitoga tunisiensis TaxID=1006576 RepID=A0A0C7NYK8_DEFTU|nr:NAD dependent epimerase [Defluviitoga tunisiensis]